MDRPDVPTTSHEILLGDFLRARRACLDHETAGLPSYGQRRVPGLRREELALLAGISTSYYTRIEQGAVRGVSPSVLDSLARALDLDSDDRAHLFRLARAVPPPTTDDDDALPAHIEALLRALDWAPAGVLAPDMRILGWNHACHAVFADHIPYDAPWTDNKPNWAELLFLDPVVRARSPDWRREAEDLAGRLRLSQSLQPDNERLAAVLARLRADSSEFAELWDAHPARDAPLGGVTIDHPTLGTLHLADTLVRPTDRDDQLVLVFLPEPGSDTERKLRDFAARRVDGRAI